MTHLPSLVRMSMRRRIYEKENGTSTKSQKIIGALIVVGAIHPKGTPSLFIRCYNGTLPRRMSDYITKKFKEAKGYEEDVPYNLGIPSPK